MLENVTSYWSGRTERERWLLIAMVVVLFFVVLVFGIWKPQAEAKQQLQKQLQEKQATLVWMRSSAQKVAQGGGVASVQQDQRVLASRVSIVLRQNQIESLKIDSKQKKQVTVQIEKTSFVKLQQALFALENQWNVQIKTIKVKKISDVGGMVSVRMVLTRG